MRRMTLSTLALLLGFLRPFTARVVFSVFTGVATVAAGIGLLGTSAYLIASAALQPSIAELQVAIVGVRFFGISRALFRYLERLISHDVNFRLLARLRVWFYRKIEPLAPARLQNLHSADLLSRAIADIETLENFYVRAVSPPLVALIVTLGMGWFIGRYDLRPALLLICAMALVGIGLPVLTHALARQPGRQAVLHRARLHANVLDAVQGMAELAAFGRAGEQIARILSASNTFDAAQFHLGRSSALGSALALLISGLTLWGVLLLTIPLVGSRIDGISLAVLALLTIASFEAVTPLSQAAAHLESSLQSARRLFDLVNEDPERQDLSPVRPFLSGPLHLEIHDLHFSYPQFDNGQPGSALVDFSLDLPPGRHVALIGPSGAGKSTLFHLLLRFWDVQCGEVRINGENLRSLAPEDIRAKIALVSQSTYLFAGTLRQNLLLANPDAGPAAIERVVEQSGLSDLVGRLPNGVDSWIGERGVQISGGERQRIAVARALLREAPLLLLDEPTAGLDAASEQRLLQVLRSAAEGRSMISITHRLVGLEDMDEILVLRDGRVVERGTHAALSASGGLYAQMRQIQEDMLGGS